MSKHTPGPVEIVGDGELHVLIVRSIPGPPEPDCLSGVICIVEFDRDEDHPSSKRHAADADLIAEAFNVESETGLTPHQLADQLREANQALSRSNQHVLDYDAIKVQNAELVELLNQIRDAANKVYQMGDATARNTLVNIYEIAGKVAALSKVSP